MSAFLRPQEFERITFRSLPGSFRGRLSQSQQFTSLWLEDRETKRQWSLDIVNFNEFAPNEVTLPAALVSTMLKTALELAAKGSSAEASTETPVVDAEGNEEALVVILMGQIYGSPVHYRFPLNPVEVDPIVSIASQLRDAREEIAAAKQEIAELKAENVRLREHVDRRSKGFFSLSSATDATKNQVVIWNGTAPRELSDFVALSADNKTLTIGQPGVYQIYVRLIVTSTQGQNPIFSLRKNGNAVAEAAGGNQTQAYQNVEVTEIVRLNANDQLDVYFQGNGNCYGKTIGTRFSGIYLAE